MDLFRIRLVLGSLLPCFGTPGIPGSGYGCDLPCNTADVNYVLEAKMDTYRIKGSKNLADANFAGGTSASDIWGRDMPVDNRSDWLYRARTFVDGGSLSQNCFGMDGTKGPLAPCLQVAPGQSMMVKVVNNIGNGMKNLQQRVPSSDGWYGVEASMLSRGIRLNGSLPKSSSATQQLHSTVQNVPGWDTGTDAAGKKYGFDSINVHFHGMEVEPHLFFPEGTSDPSADWITIEPDDSNGQQCYCYHVHVAKDQAIGTFLYHVHRHGAAAIQGWSGMLGVLAVVPPSAQAEPSLSTRNLDYELEALGVEETPFLIWDPHLTVLSGGNGSDPSNVILSTDGFLSSQANTDIIPFMVNDEFQPFIGVDQNYSEALLGQAGNVSVYLRPKQPLRLRIACITTENLCGFKLRKNFPNGTGNPDGDMQTFYHLASDGFAFDRAYPEQFFVLAGGMREDVVLMLEESGMYSFWQQDLADKRGLGNKQWPGTGPADELLAHLLVAGDEYSTNVTAEFLVGLVEGTNHGHFSPGRPKEDDIRPEEVYRTREIVFSMDAELGKIPFQQYTINAKAYDVNRADQVISTAAEQRIEEWVIVNNQNMNHPFHIHVNPFQVQEIQSNACAQQNMSEDRNCLLSDTEFYKAVTRQQFRPDKRWRDTVIVPPYGFVRIWQRFSASGNVSAFAGKSVFHCHFLAHEDTGMISNMLLTNDTSKVNGEIASRGFLRGRAQQNPLQ